MPPAGRPASISHPSAPTASEPPGKRRHRSTGHNREFFTVITGYERWWPGGLLITLACATGTVAGGLLIGEIHGMGLLANRWWLTCPDPRLRGTVPVRAGAGAEDPVPFRTSDHHQIRAFRAGIGLTLHAGCFATGISRQDIPIARATRHWPRSMEISPGAEPFAHARGHLDRVGLAGMEDRLPREVSGGRRYRVVVSGSLAMTPEVLLFDEVSPALDQ